MYVYIYIYTYLNNKQCYTHSSSRCSISPLRSFGLVSGVSIDDSKRSNKRLWINYTRMCFAQRGQRTPVL